MELGLLDKVQADISYPNDTVGTLSIVSEIECREAAIYAHYNYTQFYQLEANERASCVAQYRMHFLIEAHVQQASEAASRAGTRRGGK